MARIDSLAAGRNVHRQGHYAGVVSRLVGLGVDLGVLWGIYVLGYYAVTLLVEIITGKSVTTSSHHRGLELVIVLVWGLLYFSYQWTLNGRTIGMALVGVRVVRTDGRDIARRQAIIRTLVLGISLVFFIIALLTALIQRQRRSLPDLAAGTVVVYSWDARAARLRWLAKTEGEPAATPTPIAPPEPKELH